MIYPYHLDPRQRQRSDLSQERQAEIHDEIAASMAADRPDTGKRQRRPQPQLVDAMEHAMRITEDLRIALGLDGLTLEHDTVFLPSRQPGRSQFVVRMRTTPPIDTATAAPGEDVLCSNDRPVMFRPASLLRLVYRAAFQMLLKGDHREDYDNLDLPTDQRHTIAHERRARGKAAFGEARTSSLFDVDGALSKPPRGYELDSERRFPRPMVHEHHFVTRSHAQLGTIQECVGCGKMPSGRQAMMCHKSPCDLAFEHAHKFDGSVVTP